MAQGQADDGAKDAYFQVSDQKADLGQQTGRSATTVLAFSVLRLVLTIGTTAVLARFLPPEVQGQVAMVYPIIVVAAGLAEFGLPQAIIQRKDISHGDVSALYWINCAIGAVITLIAIALAPLVAGFYQDPTLRALMIGIAPYIFITLLAVPYVAILRRRMEVRTAERCSFIGVIAGSVMAIVAAMAGAGPWALVIQILGAQGVTLLAFLLVVKWRPAVPWQADFRSARSALAFGGQISLDRFLNETVTQLPTIIVGRAFGDAAAGLFYRSATLAQTPRRRIVSPLSGAFVPSLSRLQDDAEALRAMYIRQVTRSNLILVPLGLFVLVAPDALVLVLLGQDWVEAIPVMRWLGLLPLMAIVGDASIWVLIALGQSSTLLRARVVATIFMICAMAVGSFFGLVTFVAIVMLAQCVVAFVYMPSVLARHTPITFETLRAAIQGDAIFAICVGGAAVGLRTVWAASPIAEGFGVGFLILAALVIRIALTPRYRADVGKMLRR